MPTGTLSVEDKRVMKMFSQEREERVGEIETLQKAVLKEREEREQALLGMQKRIDELTMRLEARDSDRGTSLQQPGNSEALSKRLTKQQGQIDNIEMLLQEHADRIRMATLPVGPAPGQVLRRPESRGLSRQSSDLSTALPEDFVARIEKRFSEHERKLDTFKSALVEMHLDNIMNSVKTSRIAIRCADLSREQQTAMLVSLDDKERALKEEVRRTRRKFGLPPDGARSHLKEGLPSDLSELSSLTICQDI